MRYTIETTNLSKRWGPFHLGPLNIRVKPGEILGVMGSGGAGKTTLLRLLWGFSRPDEGRISVFGFPPHLEQRAVRRRAGFMPDNPQLYNSMTAPAFLDFVGHFYENWDAVRTREILEELRIEKDVCIQDLSKGTRVKLSLMAATGHNPELLILDEPTSGLDAPARADILQFLRSLAGGKQVSIVLSSHVFEDLDPIADGILMLNSRIQQTILRA